MSFPHWLSARLKNPERVSLQEAYLAGQAYERRTWTDVFGHLGTPDEVGNEWHALSERLEAAESDALEQARLNGMGGEREATLIAKLEAAEKERDVLRNEIACVKEVEFPRKAQAVADAWKGKCERLEAERDVLRAKIEEMEQQEPVAWMLNCQTLGGDTGWILSWTQSGAGLCNRLQGEENEKRLYALPVAKGE